MSDDHEEHEHEHQPFMQTPFGMVPVPSWLAEQMREQHATAELATNDYWHRIREALDTMSIEHLEAMANLLHTMSHSGDVGAIMYATITHETLARRKNICPVCMKNHDEEADKALAMMWQDQPVGDALDRAPDPSLTYRVIMETYHVEPVDVSAGPTGQMRCTGVIAGQAACGLVYPNLTDRMVKRPGDCHGCLEKSAHG